MDVILTYFATVGIAAGVGTIATLFISKPILALRSTRTEIAKALVLYGNAFTFSQVTALGDSNEREQEARRRFRELAVSLARRMTSRFMISSR
jgi:hypothetical protein